MRERNADENDQKKFFFPISSSSVCYNFQFLFSRPHAIANYEKENSFGM